jgi:hypothetical protein
MKYIYDLGEVAQKPVKNKIKKDVMNFNKQVSRQHMLMVKRLPEFIINRSSSLQLSKLLAEMDMIEKIEYKGKIAEVYINSSFVEFEKNPIHQKAALPTLKLLFGMGDSKQAILKALKDYFPNAKYIKEEK